MSARVVVALLATSLCGAGVVDTVAAQDSAPAPLIVSHQDFAVAVDDVFDVTLRLPPGVDTATLGADGSDTHLLVRAHSEATSRDDVDDAAAGRLPSPIDTVDVPLDIGAADERVTRPSANELALAVQTESARSTPAALQLPRWGVYPVSFVLVVDGDVVADSVTFVHRRRAPDDESSRDLALGVVLGQTLEPTIGPDGRVAPSTSELRELGRIADVLDALDAASESLGTEPIPRSVKITPSTLQALGDVDPELAERLVPALERGEVIAQPRLPFDPSSAVNVGESDLYTRLLREGEDALKATLPSARVDRSVLLATDPLSAAAVALRRDLGTQLLIIPDERYAELEGNLGGFTDRSQLIALEIDEDTDMPAMVIDPGFAQLIAERGGSVEERAVRIAAELVALARQVEESGGDVSRHGIVLARDDGGPPDAELLGTLATLLLQSDGVEFVAPSDLASTVDRLLVDGRPVRVTPLESAGVVLTERFAAIEELAFDVLGTASMLPEGEPRIAQWATLLTALSSTALSDEEAAAMMLGLRAQIDVYRAGVLGPQPYSFRVTGRTGTFRIELRNVTDLPLTVRVRVSSAKLEFDDPDVRVELPAFGEVEVPIPFRALSNGTSSVFVRIFTPALEPSPETQIVDDIVLTARVSTLTGLGQLVTGAALLVLCTWWIRHWRQSRRRRMADAVAPRHPAAAQLSERNGETSTPSRAAVAGAESDGTPAPDATASTLPPP